MQIGLSCWPAAWLSAAVVAARAAPWEGPASCSHGEPSCHAAIHRMWCAGHHVTRREFAAGYPAAGIDQACISHGIREAGAAACVLAATDAWSPLLCSCLHLPSTAGCRNIKTGEAETRNSNVSHIVSVCSTSNSSIFCHLSQASSALIIISVLYYIYIILYILYFSRHSP